MPTRIPWEGSTRRSRLPANWNTELRPQVLTRDRHRCQWRDRPDGEVCGRLANQVDHIQPGDDHRLRNLQALCEPHHRTKTAREGNAARTPLHRPPERHPAHG